MPKNKPVYVELDMAADMETLWKYTQHPEEHEKWDLRFTEISYLPRGYGEEVQRFKYATRIGFGLYISGTGETAATVRRASGERTSVLKFGSDHPLSLIRTGGGYWRYVPHASGVTFITKYDYQTRFGPFGRWFDRLLFRPLIGWATAWSFDRLRLWIERDRHPAVSFTMTWIHYFAVLLTSLIWGYGGLVPKIWFAHAGELAILQGLGIFHGWERPVLFALGVLEIAFAAAVWIWHRSAAVYRLNMALVAALTAGAALGQADVLIAPFSPAVLCAATIGLGCIAWGTAKDLPSAGKCLRKAPSSRRASDDPAAKEGIRGNSNAVDL